MNNVKKAKIYDFKKFYNKKKKETNKKYTIVKPIKKLTEEEMKSTCDILNNWQERD